LLRHFPAGVTLPAAFTPSTRFFISSFHAAIYTPTPVITSRHYFSVSLRFHFDAHFRARYYCCRVIFEFHERHTLYMMLMLERYADSQLLPH
jgi:hypothetical protein